MTKTTCALWLAAASIVIQATTTHARCAMGEQTVPSRPPYKMSDKQLREWAITSPPPKYPRASLARKVTGVVVASVLFDEEGATESVNIAQSPDAEIARAVRDAVMQWKIRPMPSVAPKATLAFYFHMRGRDGVVLTPEDMRELTNPGAKRVKREDEPPVKHLTDAEFRVLSTQPRTVLLDIRDRETFREGHEKGAVNIPFEEVLLRGPAELPVSRNIVIDCRDPLELCAMSVHWLVSNGFAQVSILQR